SNQKNEERQGSNLKHTKNVETKSFDSFLEIKKHWSLKDKLIDFYRHKFPVHKFFKIIPGIPKLFKIITKEKIDIIYERGGSYGLGVLMAKLTGRISIVDFIDIMYWNWALKNCDRIMSYFSTFQVPGLVNREKIDKVFTCADIKRFNQDAPTEKALKLMEIQDKQKIFLGIYVGGFYSWHGLEYIVKAIEIMDKQKLFKENGKQLKIALVGTGDQFNYIKELISEKNLEKYFIITGRVDFNDVPKFINAADFCLNTNTADALGMKIFEYLSCAKPVIAFNVDQIPIFFNDGVNLVFAKTKDPENLAKKMKFLYDNPSLMEKIGKNARKLVEDRYTWEQHGRNILHTIKKAIRDRLE
ncbi:MAG: glycosyltransferase, partial [Candidatus Lokiarchaeota archaeon]|nr:glycosyltransferase [Candidatus Lokiarchaeota archaeon]